MMRAYQATRTIWAPVSQSRYSVARASRTIASCSRVVISAVALRTSSSSDAA